jgi:diguanylate cyclase (GGDEF)-like protein
VWNRVDDTDMMATPLAPVSSFDGSTGASHDPLVVAATAATARIADDERLGVLVVILRPGTDTADVVSGGGTGVLRAAVSVAVASGNDRLWRDAPHGATSECAVRDLPEVIAASADGAGVRRVHTGCVRRGDTIDAVAVWFEGWSGVADPDERRRTLDDLERAAICAAERPTDPTDVATVDTMESATDARRTWNADDPLLDPTTGALTSDAFFDAIEDFDGDEATMLVVDLDGFTDVSDTWGDVVADEVLRIVVDRMAGTVRREDLIARFDHDRFALLLGGVDRSAVMQIGKGILAEIAEPLPDDLGPDRVTATVALAHQIGLVDLEELFDSAIAAVASGKRSGTGRLVLAA